MTSRIGSRPRPVYGRKMLQQKLKNTLFLLGFLTLLGTSCSGEQNEPNPQPDVVQSDTTISGCESDENCEAGTCVDGACVINNEAPVANPGPNLLRPTGSIVYVFGFDSDDADGDPLTFTWSFEEQPEGASAEFDNPNEMTTWAKLDVPGLYKVQLIAHDAYSSSEPATLEIEVRDPDFTLNECFEWPDEDFEQVFRNNIRYERHFFEKENDELGYRQRVQNLVTEDITENRSGFYGMGMPYFNWAEHQGLVLTKLDLQDSSMTFTPPLVVYPEGVIVGDEVLYRTMGIVESPSGASTETMIRTRVFGVEAGALNTTTANFDVAYHLKIAVETGIDDTSPSTVWLSPGRGEVRVEHPPSNNEVPASMIEQAWSSNTNTPAPPLNLTIPSMTAGQHTDPEFWQNITPVWHDLAQDIWSPGNQTGIDLGAIRIAREGDKVWVRIEVSDPPVSPDTSYSLDIAQTQPHGTSGDFTIYVQMQQDSGWYHAINQEAEIGSPFSIQIEEPQVLTTETSLTLSLPLNMRGSDSQPTLEEIMDGGYIRSSACLFKESHCSDQLIAPVQIRLE